MGFEIIEHTADVGIRCRGRTIEECFEQAAFGVLAINGAYVAGPGERDTITLDAPDLGALLVDWLSEVIYLHDARDAIVTGLGVESIHDNALSGWVEVRNRTGEIEGTAVKAITYHRLVVERVDEGWEATFYVDV
ncbi:MAG: archease [Actinomycetota bacterium]|nr:archease [Actinomycetota bacterium]